nr:hypothetical protein [Tanacetum cinerariifolium]
LSIKAFTLKFEKDKLVDHVSNLKGTCSKLRDEMSGYKLFKEQIESPEYLATLRGAIGCSIDKGLAAGIDHGKAERGLTDVTDYNPTAKADYISVVTALRAMDFPLLAQLESHKDASIADIMNLLCLEGLTADAPETSQVQPSLEQLMLPVHRLE